MFRLTGYCDAVFKLGVTLLLPRVASVITDVMYVATIGQLRKLTDIQLQDVILKKHLKLLYLIKLVRNLPRFFFWILFIDLYFFVHTTA